MIRNPTDQEIAHSFGRALGGNMFNFGTRRTVSFFNDEVVLGSENDEPVGLVVVAAVESIDCAKDTHLWMGALTERSFDALKVKGEITFITDLRFSPYSETAKKAREAYLATLDVKDRPN